MTGNTGIASLIAVRRIERNTMIIQLYTRKQMDPKDIAREIGVSVASVYRALESCPVVPPSVEGKDSRCRKCVHARRP